MYRDRERERERERKRKRDRERERERVREELVTFLGQIPGQMWEYTNTFVTYDRYGT